METAARHSSAPQAGWCSYFWSSSKQTFQCGSWFVTKTKISLLSGFQVARTHEKCFDSFVHRKKIVGRAQILEKAG